jgi:hypothetical protein
LKSILAIHDPIVAIVSMELLVDVERYSKHLIV